jgi:aspartate dehydrogenase
MTAVGLIGCGGIAQDVLAALRASPANGVSIIGALARPGRGEAARAKLCEIDVVEALDDLLARGPALVAEVAGQSAVAEHGDVVLRSGVDCLVISVGALADPALLARLQSAAQNGNSRILLPAGAIGGIDAIAAMRVAGLTSVRYRSRKPPAAWRGSPAEDLVDLDQLTRRTVLYKGTAGEAALLYPQNATSPPQWHWLDWDSTPPRWSSWPIPTRPAISTRSRPRAWPDGLPSSCRARPRARIPRPPPWRRSASPARCSTGMRPS